MSSRLVVVGEALVDVVVTPDGRERAHPGGSPANVAVGLARLGHDVVLVTQLGDDEHGDLVAGHLAASGVVLAPGVRRGGKRTSTARAVLDEGGAASYEFDLRWDLDELADLDAPSLLDGAAGLHVGSLGTALDPGRQAVAALVEQARRRGVLVSYDPNVRPSIVGGDPTFAADVARWLERAHLVKASDEDVAHLRPGADSGEVARQWARLLALVTHGGEGVRVATPTALEWVPAAAVEVVDTVGAGDSFMAALLDALARRTLLSPPALASAATEDLLAATSEATVAAAITCSRPGADPPWRAELDAALRPRSGA